MTYQGITTQDTMVNGLNRYRLEQLAYALEHEDFDAADIIFDMGTFMVKPDNWYSPDDGSMPLVACGTVCCAAGLSVYLNKHRCADTADIFRAPTDFGYREYADQYLTSNAIVTDLLFTAHWPSDRYATARRIRYVLAVGQAEAIRLAQDTRAQFLDACVPSARGLAYIQDKMDQELLRLQRMAQLAA